MRGCLEEIIPAPAQTTEITAVRILTLTTWHRLSAKVDTKCADKRQSLGIVLSWTQTTGFVCCFFL
jgi:hypothetical protein